MAEYVGMDVSLEEVSICVLNGEGRVLVRGTTSTDPAAIVAFIAEHAPEVVRIVHESGQISIWLTRALRALGAPVICIDARMAHKALSVRPNKSDKADAEGLAHLACSGWYREVHVKSEASDRLRTLIGARDRLLRISKCGDAAMRTLLVEAASSLITRVKRFSPLKAWAVRLAARKGFKKAAVATARKLAVIQHRIWCDGTTFAWRREAATA